MEPVSSTAKPLADSHIINVKEAIDGQKGMTGFAWVLLITCAILMAIDGYDNTAFSLAVSSMAADWGMAKSDFGWIMSVQNIGLIFGAVVFGYIGDRVGRKKSMLIALALFSVMTLLTAYCQHIVGMCIVRVLCTLGVGGLTPSIVTMSNDFAPESGKMKRVTTLFVGMNCGSALTGVVAAALLGSVGWHGIFWVGFVTPAIMFVWVLIWMPESVCWLAATNGVKGRDNTAQISKVMRRVRRDLELPANVQYIYNAKVNEKKHKTDSESFKKLFQGRMKYITPLLWLNFIICLFVAYFFKSWMPTILTVKGFDTTTASWMTSLMMIGSMVGSASIGFILDKIGLRKAAIFPIIIFFVAVAFGAAPAEMSITIALIILLGYCQSSCYDVNPAMTPLFYPIKLRGTASGLNLGIGRIGSLLAPVVGGYMLASAMPVSTMFIIVVLPEFLSCIVLFIAMGLYEKYFRGKDIEEAQLGV